MSAKHTPPFPPNAICWMTHESRCRLKKGGNCKGAVPVHGKPSASAIIPLYTSGQMAAYALAYYRARIGGEGA